MTSLVFIGQLHIHMRVRLFAQKNPPLFFLADALSSNRLFGSRRAGDFTRSYTHAMANERTADVGRRAVEKCVVCAPEGLFMLPVLAPFLRDKRSSDFLLEIRDQAGAGGGAGGGPGSPHSLAFPT